MGEPFINPKETQRELAQLTEQLKHYEDGGDVDRMSKIPGHHYATAMNPEIRRAKINQIKKRIAELTN